MLRPFAGVVYTFSNLAAIASISHGGVNGLNTASKWWIRAHNIGMGFTVIVNFGCTLVSESRTVP